MRVRREPPIVTATMTTGRRAGVLAAVYVATLAINLDVTIVNVALPSIATELDAGTRGLQWVVDGYNLAFAALVLAAGSLSDRYGRRPALILGLLGFACASVVGALVGSTGAGRGQIRHGRLRRTDLPDDPVDHLQHLPR
jgi:MFS family permease